MQGVEKFATRATRKVVRIANFYTTPQMGAFRSNTKRLWLLFLL
jgi:hypothetical protein